MAWRKLPPRLRGRVPRVSPIVAFPAIVATLAFAIVWIIAPLALVAILAGRGHEILAALLVPVALWWLYRMVREPLAIGALVAAPQSVWSVVQQQREMVDTQDLDGGRLVGLADWRPLTPAERDVLLALARQVGELPEIARQVDSCEVMAECVCGCASIGLYSTAPSVPRDPRRGNEHGEVDDLQITATGRDPAGRHVEVVLHVRLGSIRELELTAGGAHDGSADTPPDAGTLRPTGVRRGR